MENGSERVSSFLKKAESSRKKGDALLKAGRELPARQAYEDGVHALSNARELLHNSLVAQPTLPDDRKAAVQHELVETFGSLGGMQQRLGRLSEAAESYSAGALIEEQLKLPTVYNRLNALKCMLMSGGATLHELEPRISDLAKFIENRLRDPKNAELSEQGWAWADLGDCMALLGRIDEARRAYSTFAAKAETKSPERTLEVLKNIASRLERAADPGASRLQSAISSLQGVMIRR